MFLIVTFSFHVEETNKIKCYLYWNGQTMRFYPQDISQIFRYIFTETQFKMFDKKKEEKNKIMKKIHIKDEQFEGFYRSIIEKKGSFPLNKI